VESLAEEAPIRTENVPGRFGSKGCLISCFSLKLHQGLYRTA
jgi:hypothetical protein